MQVFDKFVSGHRNIDMESQFICNQPEIEDINISFMDKNGKLLNILRFVTTI